MKPRQKLRKLFPNPKGFTLDGIVAMGIPLSLESLVEAYSFGIFPWPHEDLPTLWFCPDQRGVLDFKDLYINRSLKKFLAKTNMQVTFNKDFPSVIRNCSLVPRPGQSGTWITPEIEKAYLDFFEAGYVQSVEVWDGNELVGGLYGVAIGGVFAGESMFYKKSNASKLAIISLVEKLKAEGYKWMDIQMLTPVTEGLGGKYISKAEFLRRLNSDI